MGVGGMRRDPKIETEARFRKKKGGREDVK